MCKRKKTDSKHLRGAYLDGGKWGGGTSTYRGEGETAKPQKGEKKREVGGPPQLRKWGDFCSAVSGKGKGGNRRGCERRKREDVNF